MPVKVLLAITLMPEKPKSCEQNKTYKKMLIVFRDKFVLAIYIYGGSSLTIFLIHFPGANFYSQCRLFLLHINLLCNKLLNGPQLYNHIHSFLSKFGSLRFII